MVRLKHELLLQLQDDEESARILCYLLSVWNTDLGGGGGCEDLVTFYLYKARPPGKIKQAVTQVSSQSAHQSLLLVFPLYETSRIMRLPVGLPAFKFQRRLSSKWSPIPPYKAANNSGRSHADKGTYHFPVPKNLEMQNEMK